MEDKTSNLPRILKILGGLSVIIPFILGVFQYKQSIQQDRDNNFRMVVEKLASEKVEERLAAVTSLGTYMNPENEYYNKAFDVLINLVSIELNSNILSVIRSSLEKAKPDRHYDIIQSLINLEQNIFAYEYPIQLWSSRVNDSHQFSQQKFNNYELLFPDQIPMDKRNSDKFLELLNSSTGLQKISEEKYYLENQLREIEIHHLVIARFVITFLDNTLDADFYETSLNTRDGFKFYQNSLNYLPLSDANLKHSTIKNSALSLMTMTNVDFSHCKITNTTFSLSDCTSCSFQSCLINASVFAGPNNNYKTAELINTSFKSAVLNDVYFYWADLENTDFTGAKNLKPEYFYQAKNLDKAIFDPEFRKLLDATDLSSEDYLRRIKESTLSNTSYIDICSFVKRVENIDCGLRKL